MRQARQNASYALLSDDEGDEAAPVHAAPTTAPVQKPAKQKKLRKAKASWPAAPGLLALMHAAAHQQILRKFSVRNVLYSQTYAGTSLL